MTLTARIKRWMGYDTTIKKTTEYPRYKYKITHLNGEVTEDIAYEHLWNKGSVRLISPDNNTWSLATVKYRDIACKPGLGSTTGFDTVRELEGVQEIEREKIGTTVFNFTIDWADHALQNVERDEINHE